MILLLQMCVKWKQQRFVSCFWEEIFKFNSGTSSEILVALTAPAVLNPYTSAGGYFPGSFYRRVLTRRKWCPKSIILAELPSLTSSVAPEVVPTETTRRMMWWQRLQRVVEQQLNWDFQLMGLHLQSKRGINYTWQWIRASLKFFPSCNTPILSLFFAHFAFILPFVFPLCSFIFNFSLFYFSFFFSSRFP